ncbi:protein crumbs homolog 3a isoform X1 [Chaetodon auriga]|uniref:protein crumbs homolog 3a isoform X1 n=1 Tax=Chaetodon auriga TaxID=39042 RepID=UPI004032EC75
MLDLMKWTQADAPKSQSALSWLCWSRVEMEACLDVLAIPGVVVGSVLLLVLSSNPAWGESVTIPSSSALTHTRNYTALGSETPSNSTAGPNIAAIVAPTVILGVLAIGLAVLAWLLCVVKKKRQTEGTYRPSAEEQSGASSVAAPDALKLPKEERLI